MSSPPSAALTSVPAVSLLEQHQGGCALQRTPVPGDMTAGAINKFLYEESGLLGVSGISHDMRDLLASSDPRAAEAVALFVYRIGRELGSLVAALGGLDALVLTGGIGEHAAEIRRRVCENASWLGITLDEAANQAGGPCITQDGSRPSAWVIPTNEDLMIARHTSRLLS